jgi:hypothetical protein
VSRTEQKVGRISQTDLKPRLTVLARTSSNLAASQPVSSVQGRTKSLAYISNSPETKIDSAGEGQQQFNRTTVSVWSVRMS